MDSAMSDKIPTDDYIASLWASVTEGLITWQELSGLQPRYLSTQEPVPIRGLAALYRKHVQANVKKAQRRLERDRGTEHEASSAALLAYWERQVEQAG